jgi:hypothetical protein
MAETKITASQTTGEISYRVSLPDDTVAIEDEDINLVEHLGW